MPEVPGVRTGPGAIEFAVTPPGPNSAAHACVSNCSAAFDDPYTVAPGVPTYATIVVTLMMRPHPRLTIAGARRAVSNRGALTFVSNIASNAASVASDVGPNEKTPALLMRMSTPPRIFSACTARFATEAADERSATTKSALPCAARIAATTSSPRRASRPVTRTCAPCDASASAMARPMPEVAPVMSALRVVAVTCFLQSESAAKIGAPAVDDKRVDRNTQDDSQSSLRKAHGQSQRNPGVRPCRRGAQLHESGPATRHDAVGREQGDLAPRESVQGAPAAPDFAQRDDDARRRRVLRALPHDH